MGKVEVLSVAGDTPKPNTPLFLLKEGEIDGTQLRNYYIERLNNEKQMDSRSCLWTGFAHDRLQSGNVASSQGLTDQAYLYFASSNKYEEPVVVSVDEEATFEAQVVKEKKSTIKGFTYAIRTGKRHVVVRTK